MYEVPVKIYNISKKTKSVNIKHPNGFFKVDKKISFYFLRTIVSYQNLLYLDH